MNECVCVCVKSASLECHLVGNLSDCGLMVGLKECKPGYEVL